MKVHVGYLFFLAILTSPVFAEWEKKSEKEGITVYTRPIEGSSFEEFRGVGIINAPMEDVNNILKDIPHMSDWLPNCLVSQVVEQIDSNHLIIYQILHMPFIFQDRDYVVEVEFRQHDDRTVWSMEAVNHSAVPAKDGLVRIENLSASWHLQPAGSEEEKTLVEYQVKVDPNGRAPAIMVNLVSVEIPYKTIQGLRDQVEH